MAVQFFALRHIGDRAGDPFGLIRADGPSCERYLPGTKKWVESPGDQDYLWGEEPGATPLTAQQADALIEGGKLADVTEEDLAWSPEDDDATAADEGSDPETGTPEDTDPKAAKGAKAVPTKTGSATTGTPPATK